jgi:CRP-like cAMP-binding protein/predicted MFS family arabinose efflux permease
MAGSGGRFRDALRQRDFRLLAVSYIVDAMGSWSYSIVLAVYIFDRTHSTEWLASVAASRWITGLLMGSVAGVLADRYERTKVMIVSALASAAVMVVMAVVVGSNGPLWSLIALSVGSGIVSSPYRPAAGALTPEVVGEKDLAAANGLFSTLESLTVVLGPAAGGLLLLTHRPAIGVIINAASFVIAAAIVSRLRVRATGGAQGDGNAFAQWVVGLKALASQRIALMLVLYCALDSAVYGASTVLYIPLSIHLGTGTSGYSYLLAGAALGGVIAAGLANKLSKFSRLAPVIVGSIFLQALPFAVTATIHAPVLAFVLQVISGIGMIVVDVLAFTSLQRDLPREVLSRVLGVFDAIILAFTVAASFIGAALLSSGSLDRTLVLIGFGFPAASLLGLPALLKADRASAAVVARLAPIVKLLGALDLFAGATHPMLERLAASTKEEHPPAGTVLIRQGDDADALWVLVEGSLAISARGAAGLDIELPVVEAPGYVGELGLLHSAPRSATVTTIGSTVLLRIEGQDFLDAIETAASSVSLQTTAVVRLARTAGPNADPAVLATQAE